MDRAKDVKLVLLLVFMGLHLRANSQWVPRPPIAPRPLCVSQFALASHACALLPFVPGTPPAPPLPAGPHSRHRHRHGHGHRHRSHEHGETTVEKDCCRWLSDLDSECVCDLLVRLPPFLSRPVHLYTVQVSNACNVTYQCGSRIRM